MSMDSIKRLDELLKQAGLNKAAEETQKVITDPVAAQTNVGEEMADAEEKGNPVYEQAATAEGKNIEDMPSVPSNEIPAGSTDTPVDESANGLKVTELMDEPKTAGQKALHNLAWYLQKRASGESVEEIAKEVGVEGEGTDPVYSLEDGECCEEDTARAEGPTEDFPVGTKEACMRNIAKVAGALRGIHKYASIRAEVNDALIKSASVGSGVVGKTGLPYPTACQTLQKFAAAMKHPEMQGEFLSYMGAIQNNPAYQQTLQKVAMAKRAEDIAAVVAENGVNEDQAAAMLDQALAEDPQLQQELAQEINGEALGDLADAEVDGAALEQAAAEAGVSPEDIEELAADIQEIADEAGVTPEEVAEELVTELVGDGEIAEAAPVAEEAVAAEGAPVEETKTASKRLVKKASAKVKKTF